MSKIDDYIDILYKVEHLINSRKWEIRLHQGIISILIFLVLLLSYRLYLENKEDNFLDIDL